MQGRSRDTVVKNKCMDAKGGRGGGKAWEVGTDMYTLLCIKHVTSENVPHHTGNSAQCSVVTNGGVRICVADSLCLQQELTQHCKAAKLQ